MSSMNQDPLELELREKVWRRPLTADEQAQLAAWLAAHPGSRVEWEADAALNVALARLREKPAPSNLVARVMAEIDREDLATAKARKTKTNWFGLGSWGWVPRVAVAAVLLGLATVGYRQHQQTLARMEAASNIAAVASAAPLPSAEVLENFDEIFLMPPLPTADTDLLVMMK